LAFLSDRGESGADDPKATIQIYLLRSDAARSGWVEPDIRALP